MSHLTIVDVDVSFDDVDVLERANLSIERGEVVALLGPSGSGKSTLLRVVTGVIAPDAGSLHLAGTDITKLPTHQRGVGMVFQDNQLFPHLSVGDNVAFGLKMAGVDRSERQRRAAEWLERVGLATLGDRRVGDLSGGEAKRVALARTLAAEPDVVLLDEPLTGLDRELHDQLTDDLAQLLADLSITAILVTHDHDEAATIATRVTQMDDVSGCETVDTDSRRVVELSAEQTHHLRQRVLRNDTPSTELTWPGDDEASTVHLGVVVGEASEPVAISTWLRERSPDVESGTGVQLRGMATEPAVRGLGMGSLLLGAGLDRAQRGGADHVWANARTAVLGFYIGHGFDVTSGEFLSADTAIPHRRVLRRFGAT